MSEQVLMNDEQARSPTGEILDQATAPPKTEATTEQIPPSEAPPKAADGTSQPPTNSEPPKPEAKPATSGAPETYSDFTAPEGYTLDKDAIAKALPIFKEMGLSQEAAQRLVTLNAEQMIAAAKAPASTYETMRAEWRGKVEGDADIKAYATDGKVGIEAVKVDIGRALAAIGDAPLVAEFKQAMDLTGAGDHPAFVKAMWRLAQKVGEGKPVAGKNPSPEGQRAPGDAAKPTAAKSLYPNLA